MAKRDVSDDSLMSVDLVLGMIELLAEAAEPRGLGDIAAALGISKPRAHRHLRALAANDYVHQDAAGERYEISAKLVGLGEAVRSRLSLAGVGRPAMLRLREATGEAVTLSTLVAGQVTIVELLQGRTIVQIAIRPGTVMSPTRSAHGLVALAFGRREQIGCDAPPNETALAQIRMQGWATAPGGVVAGVNALAAPAFGHDGQWRGTVAIVGASAPIVPTSEQVGLVLAAARTISERLGWRGAQ